MPAWCGAPLRLSAEPAQIRFVLEPLQPFEERRRTRFAEGSAGQPPELVLRLAGFEHAVLGAAFETAPVGEAIAVGAKVVSIDDKAAARAEMAGLRVVMNRCPGIKIPRPGLQPR